MDPYRELTCLLLRGDADGVRELHARHGDGPFWLQRERGEGKDCQQGSRFSFLALVSIAGPEGEGVSRAPDHPLLKKGEWMSVLERSKPLTLEALEAVLAELRRVLGAEKLRAIDSEVRGPAAPGACLRDAR